MHDITTIIAFLLYIYVCSLTMDCNHTLWYRQYTRGLRTPQCGVKSPNTFTSVAPRTYSIICINSESCLWSNVGFTRLLCFGTLRFALSAKVALEELLWLCPGSAGLSTSVEKAKTDCHNKARDWSLFGEVFRVPKDLCRLGQGAGPVWLTSVYRAPNSAFWIPRALPKFKIIEFDG